MKENIAIFIIVTLALIFSIYLFNQKGLSDRKGYVSFEGEPQVTPDYEIGILEPLEKFVPVFSNVLELSSMEDITRYLYSIEDGAYVHRQDLDLKGFINTSLKTNLQWGKPKILIFHTHSQEAYIDSREGHAEDTIVGMGERLSKILVKEYKIPVIHDTGKYDMVDGKVSRGNSYERMEPAVNQILKKYPSIEIMIDLHRDGAPDDVRFITDINGKPTARVMFVNGVSYEDKNGQPKVVANLPNPFVYENLAFSLQMQLNANEMYPNFTRRIYIKPYRYSLHLMPKSLLVELGANTNTIAEAENAIRPLAEVLLKTLSISR